jgi:hypothetical protein
MHSLYKSSIVLIILILIAGCCKDKVPSSGSVVGGDPCVGTVIHPPEDLLTEVEVPGLLSDASGTKGNGKLCMGKVFIAKKSITVYRVWGATLDGRWWSLSYPEGPEDAYRKANNICKEWNSMKHLTVCTLKINSIIVVGPGQSADCKQNGITYLTYDKSPVNQVYVPLTEFLDNCTNGVEWAPK